MHNVVNQFENSDDGRKREFKRQQDRLKMLAPDSERKIVTADSMIDSLLQKADTFKKTTAHNYPPWLRINTPQTCPYYEKIWSMVCISDKSVDTARISQLLLTSGLHPDILGYIWNLANKETPGQLNKQELFIVLSLVGLAQSGCTFNSADVLNGLPSPPIPRLNVPLIPTTSTPSPIVSPCAPQIKSPLQETSSISTNFGAGLCNQTNVAAAHPISSVDDDFQDFQFASIPVKTLSSPTTYLSPINPLTSPLDVRLDEVKSNAVPQQVYSVPSPTLDLFGSNLTTPIIEKCEPKISSKENFASGQKPEHIEPDEFADFQSADAFDTSIVQPSKISLPKLSSFINVSPESERKLRQLTQPESLTALPESKISSRNQVSSMPSIAVLGSSRSVGSRLANHSLASKAEKTKHHQKVMKVKPLVSAATASVGSDDLFQKCLPKNSTFLLKESKILSTDTEDESNSLDHELTRRIEIPSVGTFKETTLPVDMKTPVSDKQEVSTSVIHDALLQVEEDKYGALRELVFVDSTTSYKEIPEDFGEFLSADLPSEKAAEAWSAWNSSIIPETSFETTFSKNEFDIKTESKMVKNLDLLGDNFSNLEIKEDRPSRIIFGDIIEETKIDEFGDFVTTDYSNKMTKQISKEENKSVHSSTPSFDLSLTKQDSWSSLEISGDKEFGGKSRNVSVMSLNLEIDASSQKIANRCLNCCHTLIKDAVDIFKNVTDKSVLQEIFDSSQAKDYLIHLNIVYSIARRIYQNETDCNSLFKDIRELWQQLELMAPDILYQDTSAITDISGNLKPCLVCKGLTSDLDVEKDGSRFHITCANLWINCIESTLPSI